MKLTFLDTSYLLAVEIANDQDHAQATEHWNRVAAANQTDLVSTTFVLTETVTYLNSRNWHQKAVDLGNELLTSPAMRLLYVDESLFDAGWSYFQRHQDKDYSLTDCISFVVMQQLGIRTAFTFDHHFRQAGFDVEP